MLPGLDLSKIMILLLLALIIFGPERLPGMVEQAAQGLRQLRRWMKDAGDGLKAELGPEVANLDLRSMHPHEFIRKHLLEDPEGPETPVPERQRAALTDGEFAPWDPDTT